MFRHIFSLYDYLGDLTVARADANRAESSRRRAVARGLRESAAMLLRRAGAGAVRRARDLRPRRPGFSFTGAAGRVANRIGPVGAWLADVLFFLFGGAGLPVPGHAG